MSAKCEVCGLELERQRAGSRLDRPCNTIVNPAPPEFRKGDWQVREAGARRLHHILRGDRAGWGPFRNLTAEKLAGLALAAEAYAKAEGLLKR